MPQVLLILPERYVAVDAYSVHKLKKWDMVPIFLMPCMNINIYIKITL